MGSIQAIAASEDEAEAAGKDEDGDHHHAQATTEDERPVPAGRASANIYQHTDRYTRRYIYL